MNEPFLPLPLPSPPEHGFGPILADALRVLTRTARTLVRRFRQIDVREPLSRGTFHPQPRPAELGERVAVERKKSDPRLAGPGRSGGGPKRAARFPALPPVEF
ncbi:MAG TPA: hypothetical protein VFQ21_00180 [Gemmatimonadota bacterium]|nr:hypothetical protein [Gemmatimonadota bacterium]